MKSLYIKQIYENNAIMQRNFSSNKPQLSTSVPSCPGTIITTGTGNNNKNMQFCKLSKQI
jgi:hypothetical protein